MEKEYVYIGTRVESDLKQLIEKVARELGMSVSDFVRFAVKRELIRMDLLPQETARIFRAVEGRREE